MICFYDKKTTEEFALKVISDLYDVEYSSFTKPNNTDNFDFCDIVNNVGLEISLVISDNEQKAYEYDMNYEKRRNDLNQSKITGAKYDNNGKLKSYYGSSLTSLIQQCRERIISKNEKAKKRLSVNSIKVVDLAICVQEGGLFDINIIEELQEVFKATLFRKLFVITRSCLFVLDKNLSIIVKKRD